MDNPARGSLLASTVFESLALFAFIFRLWIRIRIQRVGWEDVWATVAFVCGSMNVASNWVHVIQLSVSKSSTTSMWIYMFTFTCLVWAVRASIVLSIIRIIPTRERLHIYGLTIVSAFLLICLALVVYEGLHCSLAHHTFEPTTSSPYFRCPLPSAVRIFELAADCIADAIAVVFPLCVLRRVTLPSRQCRLLRLLFLSNIMVAIMRCVREIFRVQIKPTTWSVVVTNVQIATCFIVCNILVIVTYLYRVLGYRAEDLINTRTTEKDSSVENDGSPARLSVPHQMTLTTVELLFSVQSREGGLIAAEENVPRPSSTVGISS